MTRHRKGEVLIIELDAVPAASAFDLTEVEEKTQYLLRFQQREPEMPEEVRKIAEGVVSSKHGPPEDTALVATWTHDYERASRFGDIDQVANKLLHLGTVLPPRFWFRVHVRKMVKKGWELGERVF